MDPNANIQEMHRALLSGDHDRAEELAGYLSDWLKGGGFRPDMTLVEPVSTLLSAMRGRLATVRAVVYMLLRQPK